MISQVPLCIIYLESESDVISDLPSVSTIEIAFALVGGCYFFCCYGYLIARPKKYKIKLTDDELKELKSVIRKNKTSKTIRCRCQIIIDLDESHGRVLTHEQSAKSNGVCLATVTNTVKKYFEGGIDAVTEFKCNVNSDNARRVLDGRAEARILELACGPVPEGHSRWTIRLLEEKSKIVLDTPASREAIRRALKKQTSTSQKRLLVHPPKR